MSALVSVDTTTPEMPSLLAGEERLGEVVTIRCPYDGRAVARVHKVGPAELEAATQAAVNAFAETRRMPAYRRAEILRTVSAAIEANLEDFAHTIALEAAKPISQARAEAGRSVFLFRYAAEEALRNHDEVIQMDAHPNGVGRHGINRRFPIGPIAAISPFNFPLNLVAHKLAPAIAAGCPIVLKPASQTPLSALKLARLIYNAGWPAGALSVLVLDSAHAAPLVEDERFKLLTFTGSPGVGWDMKRRAGRKRVTLELGGNAGVIVHTDADLGLAAKRTTVGGFSYAGQTCISVQRIFVQSQVYEAFMDEFVPLVQALRLGDPLDEQTDLSALINDREGQRIQTWLDEAYAAGAELVIGGNVRGGAVEPTILVKAGPDLKVNCQEVFAPIVTVQTYDEFEQALDAINASDYGLQTGLFTNDARLIFRAYETLEVGGLMINEVPSWRVDQMPYGGVKASGFGREGLKYAIEEMTEPRLLMLNV